MPFGGGMRRIVAEGRLRTRIVESWSAEIEFGVDSSEEWSKAQREDGGSSRDVTPSAVFSGDVGRNAGYPSRPGRLAGLSLGFRSFGCLLFLAQLVKLPEGFQIHPVGCWRSERFL